MRSLLCWLLLCVPCFGQGLTVGGPLQSPVYKIVRLKAENPAKDAAIVWDVLDEGADAIEIDGELFFTGPPGRYRIVCTEITIVGTKPAVRRTRVNVEIVGSGPNPNPSPGPGPQPQPSPPVTQQGFFIIVVEETKDAASNRGMYFVDSTLRKRIQEKGHKWLVFDKDVVDGNGVRPRDLVFYLDRATGKPLPRLFLVGLTDSKIHYEGDAPKTAGELVALLGKVGG